MPADSGAGSGLSADLPELDPASLAETNDSDLEAFESK